MSLTAVVCLAGVLVAAPAPSVGEYFQIEVVDEATGRGVPLVELQTVNAVRTAAGQIVFDVGDTSGLPETQRTKALFYALPAGTENPPATTAALFEYRSSDGTRRDYSTDMDRSGDDFLRSRRPICLVWRNPMSGASEDMTRHAP